jgi:hypothetical protein
MQVEMGYILSGLFTIVDDNPKPLLRKTLFASDFGSCEE